ncbi:MAG: hypothetical protein JWP35_1878 [Caulobacter sp.]|nr:hypothetical protein [Caulobacter sp.]
MFAILILITGSTLILGVCLFAWWKGGPAERWGGTLNVFVAACALAALLLPPNSRQTAVLVADGLLAFGLLLLAVRYANLWIGAAMLLQATQFVLHTFYYIMEKRHDPFFGLVNNLVSLGILLCIFGGTLLSWRKRSAAAVVAA